VCWALKDMSTPTCSYCSNDKRDKHMICVIEEYADLLAIEQTGSYKWLYHILGGSLSPLHGRWPRDLSFDTLFTRLVGVSEIIIATNPNFEWEATALYLRENLPANIRLTRLSRGLPNAGYIDYVDSLTLMNALKWRQEYI
jgi:recombination protein RecR